MGADTAIEWCDHTFNPWWGCTRVSPGCVHCYAETLAKRVGLTVWGAKADRRRFGDKHWNEPHRWNKQAAKAGVRARVFCASMADVFEDRRDLDAERARLWALIDATPWLDWLVLTKRPENIDALLPNVRRANLWLGCTAEDQERADERIPVLVRAGAVRARVLFVSYEPALGPVDFALPHVNEEGRIVGRHLGSIDWLIVGGESGPGARPFDIGWARAAVRQARSFGVAVFVKQLGRRPMSTCDRCAGDGIDPIRIGDDPEWCESCGGGAPNTVPEPLQLHDRKGGDVREWPPDLNVRQFPEAR